MTRKRKLEAALAAAEYYHDYAQRIKGFLKESNEKIEELRKINNELECRNTYSTWDRQEYKRLKTENRELKHRVHALEVLVDLALGIPEINKGQEEKS